MYQTKSYPVAGQRNEASHDSVAGRNASATQNSERVRENLATRQD